MRPYRLVLVLFVFCATITRAQNAISLDTALRHALERNIELQKRAAEVRKAEAQLDESARPPNPSFGYSREALRLNNDKIGEWIATGSLPLNFLWDRWSNMDSKQKSLEAQRLLLQHSKSDVVYHVQDAYVRAHYFGLLAAELDTALSVLDDAAAAARQRAQDGDISEYELKRILIAVNRLRAEVRETEIQRISHVNQLRLLIGYGPEMTLEIAPPPALSFTLQPDAMLLRSALENRNDLKAVGQLIESASAFLAHNKLKGFPSIELSAGYKKQLDQFSGPVYQVNVEIPLFKRNQTEIVNSETELDILERQRDHLQRKIASEVSESSARVRHYESLHADQDGLQLHEVLSTAVYSYKQGELSLVEFIDGLNTFTEGVKQRNDLEIKYRQSVYDLARVSGNSRTNEQ